MNTQDILKSFIAVIKPITGTKVVTSYIDDHIETTGKKFQDQIVVNFPEVQSDNQSFDTDVYVSSGTIYIELYSTSAKKTTILYDTVATKILSNKATFASSGVSIKGIGSSNLATYQEGAVSIKKITLPVTITQTFSL